MSDAVRRSLIAELAWDRRRIVIAALLLGGAVALACIGGGFFLRDSAGQWAGTTAALVASGLVMLAVGSVTIQWGPLLKPNPRRANLADGQVVIFELEVTRAWAVESPDPGDLYPVLLQDLSGEFLLLEDVLDLEVVAESSSRLPTGVELRVFHAQPSALVSLKALGPATLAVERELPIPRQSDAEEAFELLSGLANRPLRLEDLPAPWRSAVAP